MNRLALDRPAMEKAIEAAYKSYNTHKSKLLIIRDDIMVVINMRAPSNQKRLSVVDLKTRLIMRSHHVAHGVNSSDPNNRAFAIKFSNTVSSKMSSLGAMLTQDTYIGKHGLSLRLKGLDKDNSNVLKRYIVVHASNYVTDEYISKHNRAGQSHGCPAVDPLISKNLILLIKENVFFYVHY